MSTFALQEPREMLTPQRVHELFVPLKEAIDKKEFTKFGKIILSGKSFSQEAAETAAGYLKQLQGISQIDFSDFIASRNTEEAKAVLKIMCDSIALYPLEEFNISDNALGERGLRQCAAAIQDKKNLTRVYFSNNGLQADAAKLITEYLLGNSNPSIISTFHIHNNLLQDAGVAELAPLFAASPNLRDVRVSTTRLSAKGGAILAQSLLDSKTHSLTSLNLNDNTLGEKAGAILAKLLVNQPDLTYLNLGDTGIGEEALKQIFKVLQKTAPNLQVLELSHAEISEDLALLLAKLIQSKPKLIRINLEGNDLGTKGAKLVLKSVLQLPLIESVNLEGNNIGGAALKFLIKVFQQASTDASTSPSQPLDKLSVLNLNNNRISNDTIDEFRKAVSDATGQARSVLTDDDLADAEESLPARKQIAESKNAIYFPIDTNDPEGDDEEEQEEEQEEQEEQEQEQVEEELEDIDEITNKLASQHLNDE